jgi:hypothetical protein
MTNAKLVELHDHDALLTYEPPVRSRADAVRYAIASTTMEGGVVTDETERLLTDWANGSLDDDELMAAILNDCGPRA